MTSNHSFGSRLKVALPLVSFLFASVAGILDGVRVLYVAPHMFGGFLDKVLFILFAMGIYALVGLVFGFLLTLAPPGWFTRQPKLDRSALNSFYLSFLIGAVIGLLVLMANIDYPFLRRYPVEYSLIFVATLIGGYFGVRLTFSLLNNFKTVGKSLERWGRLFGNPKISLLFAVIFMVAIVKVMVVSPALKLTQDRDKPNVILISLDTLTATHLGCYGYPRPTSPNLDRFASDAVLFKNHFSVSRSTLPSHMSIFTSVYPSVHRATDSITGVLDDRFATLAEILQENGYETGAFVDGGRNVHIGAVHGFDQGFDFYEHFPERFLPQEKLFVFTRLINLGSSILQRNGHPVMHSENIFASGFFWLTQRSYDRPFFLFLHTFDIHSDFGTKLAYVAPPEFRSLEYSDYKGDYTGCNSKGKCASEYLAQVNKKIRRGGDPSEFFSEEDIKYIASLYDCGIEYTDFHLGSFLNNLRETNLLDNTIVVITADHGEEFFQHGQLKHTQYYDEIIKVPLVIRFPGKLEAGTVVDQLTRSIDVAPTILDLCEIQARSEQFQGSSLLTLTQGINGKAEQRTLFGGEDRPLDSNTKIMRTPEYFYIRNGSERKMFKFNLEKPEELYNLSSDPNQLTNVIDEEVDVYENMRLEVDKWTLDCVDLRSQLIPEEITKEIEIDERSLEELKSLGYIK